jgi:hypothetical protein
LGQLIGSALTKPISESADQSAQGSADTHPCVLMCQVDLLLVIDVIKGAEQGVSGLASHGTLGQDVGQGPDEDALQHVRVAVAGLGHALEHRDRDLVVRFDPAHHWHRPWVERRQLQHPMVREGFGRDRTEVSLAGRIGRQCTFPCPLLMGAVVKAPAAGDAAVNSAPLPCRASVELRYKPNPDPRAALAVQPKSRRAPLCARPSANIGPQSRCEHNCSASLREIAAMLLTEHLKAKGYVK